MSASNVASSLTRQGKHAIAERINREVLGVRRRVLGEEHPDTLVSANNLATSLSNQTKYAEAKELLHATLQVSRRVLGSAHPKTLAFAESLDFVRSRIRSGQPSKGGGKATARRSERATAPALSPTALEEADARSRAAEAELLAMLDLEDAGSGPGGASGSTKGKANFNLAKGQGGKR
jgi:hypothetical protein